MSSAVEARGYLADLIDPRIPLKSAIPGLASRLGLSARRVRALWNGEARRIDADEIKALRSAALQNEVVHARKQVARLQAMAARLEAVDADFHAPDIAAARAQADRLLRLIGGGA